MDENSRYKNKRRTIIMLEQSIKEAINSFVFEPNDVNTWVEVKSMIIQYLNTLWKQGELAGTVPEDAFGVDIGLGSTMSPDDIIDGIMRLAVKVALEKPADFTILTFQQQMQKS